MAVKIRLARRGRSKAPFYHIVVADARAPRDGKFIEQIGAYNPLTSPATIELDRDKAFDWIMKGAQPTDTVRAMLSYRGVMFRKHLQIGVNKGALTQEQADAKIAEWLAAKEAKISDKEESLEKAKADAKQARMDAETKVKEARAEAIAARLAEEEAANAPAEEAAEEAEESADAEEATDASEEKTEE